MSSAAAAAPPQGAPLVGMEKSATEKLAEFSQKIYGKSLVLPSDSETFCRDSSSRFKSVPASVHHFRDVLFHLLCGLPVCNYPAQIHDHSLNRWSFLYAIEFYKGYGGLLFPPNVWGLEMSCIVVFFLIQLIRLDLGRRANRNEHATATKFFMIFSILACFFCAYFALYTTYVLTVDIGFGLIGFFFAFLEIFISFYTFVQFNKLEVL